MEFDDIKIGGIDLREHVNMKAFSENFKLNYCTDEEPTSADIGKMLSPGELNAIYMKVVLQAFVEKL